MAEAVWRRATLRDLDAIEAIEARVHTLKPEGRAVFASKLLAFPGGCWMLDKKGDPLGYGVFHPWRLHDAPALHTLPLVLPAAPDCLFLHDVALLPGARGQGAARAFLPLLRAAARDHGLRHLALVSVYDTAPIWGQLGFAVAPFAFDAVKRAQYGDSACYMVAAAGP